MPRPRPPADRCAELLPGYLSEVRSQVVGVIRELLTPEPAREHASILYDLMLDYPLREAKGLRPALCVASCRALGGELEAVLASAAVIELYHNAFLVHDDLEDRSQVRRGAPTLHVAHGPAIAVNVGDGMLALTLGPLLTNIERIGLGPALRVLEAMGEMATRTVEGQAIELDWIRRGTWALSDADYVDMVVRKTGWYSFITPVRCGAYCASAPDQLRATLEAFARELAIAFQIQDDVLSLEGSLDEFGKDPRGDLWEGKRTLILLHALRTTSPELRARAQAILAKPVVEAPLAATAKLLDTLASAGRLDAEARAQIEATLGLEAGRSEAEVDELAAIIDAQRSCDHARSVARRHIERARDRLEACDHALADSTHRDLLWGLVDFVLERRW